MLYFCVPGNSALDQVSRNSGPKVRNSYQQILCFLRKYARSSSEENWYFFKSCTFWAWLGKHMIFFNLTAGSGIRKHCYHCKKCKSYKYFTSFRLILNYLLNNICHRFDISPQKTSRNQSNESYFICWLRQSYCVFHS